MVAGIKQARPKSRSSLRKWGLQPEALALSALKGSGGKPCPRVFKGTGEEAVEGGVVVTATVDAGGELAGIDKEIIGAADLDGDLQRRFCHFGIFRDVAIDFIESYRGVDIFWLKRVIFMIKKLVTLLFSGIGI